MNGWIATKDRLPEEGQEVTVRMNHGQIAQIVKDSHYSGGWKQANCQGWEMVTWHADSITHWRPEIFERPEKTGPVDTERKMQLTDNDFCALEYAAAALRAIADRKEIVGDVIQPMNDMRNASSRAKIAIARLEPVLRKLDSKPAN